MITFKQFLKEEKSQLSQEGVVNLIKTRCQSYLKLNINLYRGMADAENDFFEGTVRKNRIPKDTSVTAHNILNDYFKKRMGINARSETLFVTPDDNTAGGYGRVYEIFPIGDFDYIWSPIVEDANFLESKSPNPKKDKGPKIKKLNSLIFSTIKTLWPVTKTMTDNKIADLIYWGYYTNTQEEQLKIPKLSLDDEKSASDKNIIISKLLELYGDDIYKYNVDIEKNIDNEVMLVCDRYVAVVRHIAQSKEFKNLLA